VYYLCRYVGSGAGDILTINFVTGDVVGTCTGVHSRDITKMMCHRNKKDISLFTSSLDGRIRMLEELDGELYIKNTVESAFGPHIGILDIVLVPSLRILVGASVGKTWGIWNTAALKQLSLFEESSEMNAIVVVGASGDEGDAVYQEDLRNAKGRPVQSKESILIIAVCTVENIRVYCIDTIDYSGHLCMVLSLPAEAYINCAILFNAPPHDSVNFALSRETTEMTANISLILSACTDDGRIISWDASDIRKFCETEYRKRFRLTAPVPEVFRPTPGSTRPNTAGILGENIAKFDSLMQDESSEVFLSINCNFIFTDDYLIEHHLRPMSTKRKFSFGFNTLSLPKSVLKHKTLNTMENICLRQALSQLIIHLLR
jgi:hypothetical protein